MKKIGLILVALAALVGLSSCDILGGDGKVYLSEDWPNGTLYRYFAEMPSPFAEGPWVYDTYYEVAPGEYYFKYYILDGATRYPSSGVYYGLMTLVADEGAFLDPGDTTYFDLYLGFSGASLQFYFESRAMEPVTETEDGTWTYEVAQNGYILRLITGPKTTTTMESGALQSLTK